MSLFLLLVLARWLHFGSGLLLASVLYFREVVWHPDLSVRAESRRFSRRLGGVAWAAWVMQLLSGALWFWMAASDMSGTPMRETWQAEIVRATLFHTRFGHLAMVRGGLALVLGGLLLFQRRRLALVFAFGLLVSLAWAGHAGADLSVLHLGADAAHLALAALWPVGLLPLALFLFHPSPAPREALGTLGRFSVISGVAVIFLFITGLVNSFYLVPRISALFTSDYGKLLCAKTVLFFILAAFGFVHRFQLLPRLKTGSPKTSFRLFRRLIFLENFLVFLVVLIVAWMGTVSPPQ